MRKIALSLLGLSLMTINPVFADHHCGCDDKCAKSCEEGKSENCKCEKCDCKKEGKSCHKTKGEEKTNQ